MAGEQLTVETTVRAIAQQAWDAYTSAEHITQWNFASDDWHCPSADVDLRVGGRHNARMEAKDGTRTTFKKVENGTLVTTSFDPDSEAPLDMQQAGWQSIIDNYRAHVERITER